MKTKTLFIVAVVAIIALMSCENGTTEPEAVNPFIGTWESEWVQYVFTENQVTVTSKPSGDVEWNAAPYTYDGIHLTIYSNERIETSHYVFKGDKLFFSGKSNATVSKVVSN